MRVLFYIYTKPFFGKDCCNVGQDTCLRINKCVHPYRLCVDFNPLTGTDGSELYNDDYTLAQ